MKKVYKSITMSESQNELNVLYHGQSRIRQLSHLFSFSTVYTTEINTLHKLKVTSTLLAKMNKFSVLNNGRLFVCYDRYQNELNR